MESGKEEAERLQRLAEKASGSAEVGKKVRAQADTGFNDTLMRHKDDVNTATGDPDLQLAKNKSDALGKLPDPNTSVGGAPGAETLGNCSKDTKY